LVFAMTYRCWVRNAEWRDNYTLYAATYEVHRQAVGALRLHGNSLVERSTLTENSAERTRLLQEGITLLKKAIDIDLGFTDAQRSLGYAYYLAGDFESALRHVQIADMQVPDHPPTEALREELSRIISERDAGLGQDAGLDQLVRNAAAHPEDTAREIAVVRKLHKLGRTKESVARLEQAGDRFEKSVEWQIEYAVMLLFLNQRDDAIDRYKKGLALRPDDSNLLVELAMLLFERRNTGDVDEAWTLADRAEALAPNAPWVLVCKAELLAFRGDPSEAVRLYERAITQLPPSSRKRRVYEARAAALGRRGDTDG
ncbi:MAG: tetratricopeptide repeat protein, partial [Planctomycetes bacterium]|nr:tetratricopeptide repeat protein [Planctomycetota bacterium]